MPRPENFDVDKVIEYLQGTCETLQDGVETFYPDMDEDDLTQEDHRKISNEIFFCEQCGWWYEVCEMADNSVVDDTICLDCWDEEE